MLKEVFDEAVLLEKWFNVLGRMLSDTQVSKCSLDDLFAHVSRNAVFLKEQQIDPSSEKGLDDLRQTLILVLNRFENMNLLDSKVDRERFTKSLRIRTPTKLARLSKKGARWLNQHKAITVSGFFISSTLVEIRPLFNKLRLAAVALGTIASLAKFYLQWGTIHSVAAGAIAAAIAFLVSW